MSDQFLAIESQQKNTNTENKSSLLSHHVSSVFLRKYFFPFLIADFFTPRIPKQAIREQLLTLYRNQELFFYLYNVILTTRDVHCDQQS